MQITVSHGKSSSLWKEYEQFSMEKLLDLADTNEQHQRTIEEYLKSENYQEKTFILDFYSKPSINSKNIYNLDDLMGYRYNNPYAARNVTSPTVTIENFETAERFLKHFGSLVTRLKFTSEADQNSGIMQFVERYSIESLEVLKLYNVHGLWKIFENVHSLHLRLNEYDDNLQLGRYFPKLSELHFEAYLFDSRFTSLEQTYPHLTHFVYDCELTSDGVTTLRNVLRANPQLRRLAVEHYVDYDLLADINQSLPVLDELSVIYSRSSYEKPTYTGGRTVRFNSVRKFTMSVSFIDKYSYDDFGISFNNLEELDILTTKFGGLALRLLEENVNLKRLSLARLYDENSDFIANMVTNLTLLEEVVVPWTHDTTQKSILRIMDETPKLTMVTFAVIDAYDASRLFSMISPHWHFAGEQDDVRKSRKLLTFTPL